MAGILLSPTSLPQNEPLKIQPRLGLRSFSVQVITYVGISLNT